MAPKNNTPIVMQGKAINISKPTANGGPTLAELCKHLGGEAGTTLENSAKPASYSAPTANHGKRGRNRTGGNSPAPLIVAGILAALALVALAAIVSAQ